jgi:hypothetical protein
MKNETFKPLKKYAARCDEKNGSRPPAAKKMFRVLNGFIEN